MNHIPYSAKLWRIDYFRVSAGENVSEFTIANIATLVNLIWWGKILANGVRFAKLAKVFPRQNFAQYGNFQKYL